MRSPSRRVRRFAGDVEALGRAEIEFDPASFAERRKKIAATRKKALDANVPGVGKSGGLLPTISKQLVTIGEPAVEEAYTLAYRPLSWDVHGGARALLPGRFQSQADGRATFEEPASVSVGARALAISTFASTLKLCGVHLLRPQLEKAAAQVLESWVPQEAHDSPPHRNPPIWRGIGPKISVSVFGWLG